MEGGEGVAVGGPDGRGGDGEPDEVVGGGGLDEAESGAGPDEVKGGGLVEEAILGSDSVDSFPMSTFGPPPMSLPDFGHPVCRSSCP